MPKVEIDKVLRFMRHIGPEVSSHNAMPGRVVLSIELLLDVARDILLNGMLIAFTLSIDDFVISYFTAGSEVSTLAMQIYAMTRKRISPEINALSTILFVTVLGLLLIVNLREMRQSKLEEKRKKALQRDGMKWGFG